MRRVLTWMGAAAGALGVLLVVAALNSPDGGSPAGLALVALAFLLLVGAGAAPKTDSDRS